MAPHMALGPLVGSSFRGQIFCPIFYKLNFEVSHGKLNKQTYARLLPGCGVSRECQTFAKDYPTILFEPSTDFFGLIILGREKTKSLDLRQLVACLPCQVILDKVTNQQWCFKTPIPGYKNKAIQSKGCEQESSSSWYRVGIRCLVNQIWTDQSDYQILREKRILCNSQQCTWFHVNLGIQVFFWSILLISSNFHILSRMMIILSSLFFACLWLPCKGVITNLNDALFRKLTQQFQEHVAFNLLPRKTNSSAFIPQTMMLGR